LPVEDTMMNSANMTPGSQPNSQSRVATPMRVRETLSNCVRVGREKEGGGERRDGREELGWRTGLVSGGPSVSQADALFHARARDLRFPT
jgi:hypothetical protein